MSHPIIRKSIILNAPRARVWQAICEARLFGVWFGAAFEGPFVAGQIARGRIVPTRVDPEVARLQEPHAGTPLTILIETIDPMRSFSFRWHPFALGPAQDYAEETMTLVTFTLADCEGGVLLTVTETGFDDLPPARRGPAFEANSGGWAHQMRLIERYLTGNFDQ
jgi:uncharacterized protein YndB with AHSA1/START domain